MPRRPLLAPALLALALSACGSAAPATSPSGSPLPGDVFSASDFTTVVPNGWTDATNDRAAVSAVGVPGTMAMLLIAPPTVADRTDEHIDVSITAPEVPVDQLAGYLESVAQNGASNVTTVETFALDGATGIFETYDLRAHGVTNQAQDMVVDHGGNTYEIVLNTAVGDFAQQQHALQQVLDAWRWTG